MTQPLNLDQIQARHAAATPGTWTVEWDRDDVSDIPFPTSIGPISYVEHHGERFTEDARFVEHAHDDTGLLLDEVRRLRAELARTRDVLKATQQASAEDPVTCESCGHIESAHDPDGERDCHASGARVFTCSCSYFIPCYPAPAAEGV